MPTGLVLEMATDAATLAVMLAGPLLGAAVVVGLAVSIVQAVTSIQEQTLSFVPKLAAVGAVFLILLSWMLQRTVQYTVELFTSLPNLAQ